MRFLLLSLLPLCLLPLSLPGWLLTCGPLDSEMLASSEAGPVPSSPFTLYSPTPTQVDPHDPREEVTICVVPYSAHAVAGIQWVLHK